MYQLLKNGKHIRRVAASTDHGTQSPDSGTHKLQHRIHEVCKGHLRWCFDKDVLLADQSWPLSRVNESTDQSENESRN